MKPERLIYDVKLQNRITAQMEEWGFRNIEFCTDQDNFANTKQVIVSAEYEGKKFSGWITYSVSLVANLPRLGILEQLVENFLQSALIWRDGSPQEKTEDIVHTGKQAPEGDPPL